MHALVPLVGRILIAIIFVVSGIGKITAFGSTAGYIASKGLPLPELLTIGAIIVELGGGLMLVLGWKTRWVAAALFVFTGVAAVIFHNFWSAPPDQVQGQMTHFLKNISMMGGILYVAAFGAGPASVDARAT